MTIRAKCDGKTIYGTDEIGLIKVHFNIQEYISAIVYLMFVCRALSVCFLQTLMQW